MIWRLGKMLPLAALGVALACLAAPAKAAPVNVPLYATVTGILATTDIALGDVGQGSLTYDDSIATGGGGYNRYQITDLSITFPDATAPGGTRTFAPTSFGINDRIFFTDPGGVFAGVTLDSAMFPDAWGLTGLEYGGLRSPNQLGFNFLNGDVQGVVGTLSEVPLPAAAWLFLGGLAALAGVRQRRRAQQA